MNQKELYSDGELTRKRWMVLLASCMINLCIGSLYTWSVFSSPLAAHLSQVMGIPISPSDLSIVFSIGNSFGFITMIIGGALNQAIGARRVVFGGGILFGVGFILCGIAQSIGLLILGYGICSGLAMGFIYGMTISNTVKFFPDRAGLAGGLTTAAYGISSVLLPPLANGLIEWLGVGRSFIVIGGFIIVVVGFFSLWIIPCPPGFLPAGFRPAGTGLESQEGKDGGADYSWKEMMTSPLFYIMLIMLYFGAVSGLMMLSQAFNMARDMIGMSTAQAALVVSVLALFNTFGRIVGGMAADRIGTIRTVTGIFILALVAMGLLYMSGEGQTLAFAGVIFYAGICIIGLCFGSFMGLYPKFTAEIFGRRHSGINYGIMFFGFNMAGLTGPLIVTAAYRMGQSYQIAFIVALAFALLGILFTFLFRKISATLSLKANGGW